MDIRLETERFILRDITLEDAVFMFEMNNDPDVVKYTGEGPFESLQRTKEFMVGYYARQKPGTGRWAVEDKNSGQLHGWCGIKYLEEIESYDIGYRLVQSSWGKGIATETARPCVKYAFETLQLDRLIGLAMHANLASIHVLQKIGMVYSHDDLCQDHPAQLYAMDKKRYQDFYLSS